MDAIPLQVLFAARLRRQLGQRNGLYRDFFGLHFVIDGRVSVAMGEERFILEGDWVWTGYPGPRITFAPSGRLPRLHYRVGLGGDLLWTWLAEGLWPRRPLPVSDAAGLQHLADRLLACLVGDEPLDIRLRANAMEAFLLELHRQQRAERPVPSWVLDTQRHLEVHWAEDIDYARLAARYHMPVHSLRRAFKLATGIPIHSWLLQQRHRQTQRLLLETDHDLATIAARCGYHDVAFFSRQFKRFAGMSPSAFRRAGYG